MKSKVILGLFLAFVTLAFTVNFVVASEFATIDRVEVNDGVELTPGPTYIGYVSNTIPVLVEFTGEWDVDNPVTVKAYIEGYKSEIQDSAVLRTPLREDISGYTVRLLLQLPSSMDLNNLEEELDLVVRFSAKGETSFEEFYTINMQRDLYSLNILSVDAPTTVNSGSTFPVDVVVENNGNDRLENVYVRASIPDLGIQKRVYMGDLDPLDESEQPYDDGEDLDEEDTVSKRIYLTLPRGATPGTYNLEVEAYNYDTEVQRTLKLVVDTVETKTSTPGSKTIAPGQETTFTFEVGNFGDAVVLYKIMPEESQGLIVEVEPSELFVSGEDSKTVKVNVRATKSAEEGTHVVVLNVNNENGELVKQVSLSVNVEKSSTTFSGSRSDAVFILTVILVIVFVVLLIILLVLLTKKPVEAEEYGETSYY